MSASKANDDDGASNHAFLGSVDVCHDSFGTNQGTHACSFEMLIIAVFGRNKETDWERQLLPRAFLLLFRPCGYRLSLLRLNGVSTRYLKIDMSHCGHGPRPQLMGNTSHTIKAGLDG